MGHVNPSLALAHALRARGHEPAIYTGGSARPLIEREGFKCFPFKKVDEEDIQHAVSHIELPYSGSILDRLQRATILRAKIRNWLVGTVPAQVADLEDIVTEWPPDVIVSETGLWGPLLVLHDLHRI